MRRIIVYGSILTVDPSERYASYSHPYEHEGELMIHSGSEYGTGRSNWVVAVKLSTEMTVSCGSVRGMSFPPTLVTPTWLPIVLSYTYTRYISYLLVLHVYLSYPYLISWSICNNVASDSRPEPHFSYFLFGLGKSLLLVATEHVNGIAKIK